MKYLRKNSEHKQSCNVRSLVIALCLGILIIQVSIACGANPQAHLPTALAASHTMNCVNPLPPNDGATAPPAPATPGIVVINEVLPFPQAQWNCTVSASESNAWIEIYNPQNQPYDLYAVHASIDEGPGTDSYVFPFGSIISPYGFFVVFPFANLYPNSFTQLPPLRLIFNSQVVIDQVSTPDLLPDTSYARIPDGGPNWQITTAPTIGSSNQYPTEYSTGTASNTSTPAHTTKQKTTTTHNGSTSNDKSASDTPNTGIQPTWSALRLPSSEQHYFTAQQGNSSSPSASTTHTDLFDPLKKILLTLLTIIIFSALLWGWRLYQKRGTTMARSIVQWRQRKYRREESQGPHD